MLNEEGVACSGVVSDSRRAFTLNHSDRSTHLVDRASDAVYVLIDDGGFSQWPYLLSFQNRCRSKSRTACTSRRVRIRQAFCTAH